jgi:hypothetical protein
MTPPSLLWSVARRAQRRSRAVRRRDADATPDATRHATLRAAESRPRVTSHQRRPQWRRRWAAAIRPAAAAARRAAEAAAAAAVAAAAAAAAAATRARCLVCIRILEEARHVGVGVGVGHHAICGARELNYGSHASSVTLTNCGRHAVTTAKKGRVEWRSRSGCTGKKHAW